jgi:hypothetical protein
VEFDETLDDVEDLRTRDSSNFCVSESPFVDCLLVLSDFLGGGLKM